MWNTVAHLHTDVIIKKKREMVTTGKKAVSALHRMKDDLHLQMCPLPQKI